MGAYSILLRKVGEGCILGLERLLGRIQFSDKQNDGLFTLYKKFGCLSKQKLISMTLTNRICIF